MKYKTTSLLVIGVLISFCSCSRGIKYDAKKWNNESDRGYYHYRNSMLDDLIENHNLKGKTIKELEELFGYINYDSTKNQSQISFEVYQEWSGTDPSYTKYLVLRLDKNKTVDSIFIDEYER